MKKLAVLLVLTACVAFAQTGAPFEFQVALPEHKGQLRWKAPGFEIIQTSAKTKGQEIGLRGRNASGRLTFLGYLFLVPETKPATSTKCRDAQMASDKKADATIKILKLDEIQRENGLPVELVTYTYLGRDQSLVYAARGFVATEDICGDLAFFNDMPISADDQVLRDVFVGFAFDPSYTPQFSDMFTYAQILYQNQQFPAAGPMFEKALAAIPSDGSPFPSAKIAQRVTRDQAGMAYGISGDYKKARKIFEQGVIDDPDYPLYYYNLACSDAEENKLKDAKAHLQQAFDRKSNVNAGEKLPDPTTDNSFLPHMGNKDFWTFVQRLQASR